MTYRGHVRNGQIALDDPAPLPEGAEVSVQVLNNSDPQVTRREILQMSIEQRRQLLMRQSDRLAGTYADDAERTQWQGGDILE